ncbi:MAG TPA: hypothetical protein VN890_01005 [Methylocella sp.]|nr:hypothetical protein [Methylocella sp.]
MRFTTEPSRRAKGKRIFLNTVIGLLLILVVWIVTDIATNNLIQQNDSLPQPENLDALQKFTSDVLSAAVILGLLILMFELTRGGWYYISSGPSVDFVEKPTERTQVDNPPSTLLLDALLPPDKAANLSKSLIGHYQTLWLNKYPRWLADCIFWGQVIGHVSDYHNGSITKIIAGFVIIVKIVKGIF